MGDFEFDEDPIEVGCEYDQLEECRLSGCHQKHKRGFILRTKCGKYFNIGQDCGDTHFGVKLERWTEGFEAAFKANCQKSILSLEPARILRKLEELTPRLLQIERVNHFIWDSLPALAKEAASHRKETKFRGLEFIQARLHLREKIDVIKVELTGIIAAVERGAVEMEDDREAMLKSYAAAKGKITSLEKYKQHIEDFFGTSPGLGPIDKGANLVNVFRHFKCSWDSAVRRS